ncbi:methanobactin [Azospirillum sp. B510]|nr:MULTISPECIES: methanobactin [Alphaproteobacteria]
MTIKIAKKQTLSVAGRAGACCGSCCAPVGVN